MEDLSRSNEFQDAVSAERSGLLDIILLPAGGLKTDFSGNLKFSEFHNYSLVDPSDLKIPWWLVKGPWVQTENLSEE